MFEIKETDLSWNFYRRWHGNTERLPHPENLCNYFWSCAGGFIKWTWLDVPFWLVFPVIVAACYFILPNLSEIFQNTEQQPDPLIRVMCCFSEILLLSISFLYILLKFIWWAEEQTEKVKTIICALIVTTLFSLLFSKVFHKADTVLSPWYLLYGFLTFIGFAAVLGGIILASIRASMDGSLIKEYFRAVKNKLCPLVKIPGEDEKIVGVKDDVI